MIKYEDETKEGLTETIDMILNMVGADDNVDEKEIASLLMNKYSIKIIKYETVDYNNPYVKIKKSAEMSDKPVWTGSQKK